MDDYDDVQNWLSLSEVNTKENLSVGGRKLVADIMNTGISESSSCDFLTHRATFFLIKQNKLLLILISFDTHSIEIT